MMCMVAIMLFIFGVTAGISYAYFTDHKEVSNTLNFGKLMIATNESNVVELTLTGDPVETKRLGVSDKVTIAGSIGLEENSVPAYIRMKMKVYESGTTTEIKSTFNEAFMAEMAKVVYKESNNVEMQWFIVGKYLYLGNKIEAGKPFVYSNANTNANKNEITLTEAMVPNELQGKDVDVKFTLQAIQSAGMGLTLSNYTQANATSISQLAVWQEIFGADLNAIYSNEYATGYVRGTLNDTEYKAGAQVARQMTKSPYNYFAKSSDNTGNYVAFGFFPQTIKTSSVKIDENNKETFNGVEYYLGSDGYLYEKVKENANGTSYKYSDGNPISQSSANKYKYFKLEPIIWQVLTESDGSAFLLSVSVLTASAFGGNETYAGSTIESYLKGNFYNKAFTSSAKNKINSKVNVATATSGNVSSNETTFDETTLGTTETGSTVFLLGYKDVINTSYGFKSSDTTADTARVRYPTDYAGANYVYRDSTASSGSWWWLRSRYTDYDGVDGVRYVSLDGTASEYTNFGLSYTYDGGCVPALFLNI